MSRLGLIAAVSHSTAAQGAANEPRPPAVFLLLVLCVPVSLWLNAIHGVRNASVSTRPVASDIVTPVRNASVGAMSMGAAGSRYSPFLMP